jgi:hypothetical protein
MADAAGGLKERLSNLGRDLRDPKVDVARGVARKITRSAHVSGDQHGVGTSQVVTCEVEGRPVEIWMPSVPMIDEGDELIVAGRSKFGKLEAYAFRNLANGTSGHWDYQFVVLFGIGGSMLVLLAFSCVMPLFFLGVLLFAPAAGFWLVEKHRIYKSYKLIMSMPARADQPNSTGPGTAG